MAFVSLDVLASTLVACLHHKLQYTLTYDESAPLSLTRPRTPCKPIIEGDALSGWNIHQFI